MVGSSSETCKKRSTACRMATYSRATAFMRDCHWWLCGMLPQLRNHLLQCLLRERHGRGLAHRGRWLGAGEHVMQVPPIFVVVKAGDVVVGRHEVEIDHTLGTVGRSPHRFE